MTKTEIENWFTKKAREFSLNSQGANTTILCFVQDYNNMYFANNLQSEREFNPVVFVHLFTKVRTIAFSTNSLSNKEFLQYRELLIIELNYYDKSITLDFARVLSNQNLQIYSKKFYRLIYIMFSHFVEIYNNLHQYKEATINTNIRIAKTYLEEAQKSVDDKELQKSLDNIYDFLKLVYYEYKEILKFTSSLY